MSKLTILYFGKRHFQILLIFLRLLLLFWCTFGFCSENHTNRSLPAGILCKGYEPAMLKSVQKIVFRLIYNDKHRMGIDVCNITGSVVASVVFILFRHISKERKR